MKVLVIGAAGMIGRKLVERFAREGALGGAKITNLEAVDIVAPSPPPAPFPIQSEACDIAAAYVTRKLAAGRPDVVFLLASVVSGEAEADFDKGYGINLDGTRLIFDALRLEQALSGGSYRPRIVFTSSIAVFGAPFPEKIHDEFFTTPLTSYGTQKAICELLLSDYSRRGFFDGIAIRLPTICVRPGKPNKAASGFFSNIIREPLKGEPAVLPVEDSVRHHHASPRAAVGFLLHAATMDLAQLGARRALTMPGVSVTVAEQIEALRRVAGDKAVALIKREPDETIRRIVAGWPRQFDAKRAEALGFKAETDFDAIIRAHIEDEHV
ncbi:MAG: SDR family oxidoreductase [Pseudomonadota bacterium]|nr:SDR family oxidoreductase [Pseudomonadota bacterium]